MENKFISMMDTPIIAASADPEVWEYVKSTKRAFIEEGIVPEPSCHIPQEVIDSWIISKQNNVDSHRVWPPYTLPANVTAQLLEDNRQLIEVAVPFLKSYNKILQNTEFNMVLYDANGIIIDYSLKHKDENIAYGGVRSEIETGTTAHVLATNHKRPVQIIGPINYCKALENNVTSSAPLLNEYGELIGVIVLYQINATGMWQLGHNLGWVTSTAMAISSQLRLYRRDTRLKVMDETFKAALENSKDAFISIDTAGHIINFNKEASSLICVAGQKTKLSIFEIVENTESIKQALKTGDSLKNQHLIFNTAPKKYTKASIEPFMSGTKPCGAIIKIIKNEPSKNEVTFASIIHQSRVISGIIDTAELVSKKPVNILLLGESGTGKELFAQAIHNSSGSGPFIAINCASMPTSLIESELFGYEKGAFTGADKEGRKGKIEHADGGTLFLDEIGDMPLDLQPVLLRVLEERKVVRIGGHKSIPVNFRVIAATNRPLFEDVKQKLFRGDLYFRISVINLEIPPLRERGDDILLLAEKFINNICKSFELPTYKLADETKELLMRYDWPGNIRQLNNAMTYAVSFAKKQTILPSDLPKEVTTSSAPQVFSELKDMETDMLKKTIANSETMEDAATRLGISRSTLYRKLKGK